MRKSVIREMFSGRRGTYAHIKLSGEYEEAKNKASAAVDAFLEKLTPRQQEEFHNAYEFMADQGAVYAEDHFIEGFKFGLALGFEAALETE